MAVLLRVNFKIDTTLVTAPRIWNKPFQKNAELSLKQLDEWTVLSFSYFFNLRPPLGDEPVVVFM